jgi:hypothetical protein
LDADVSYIEIENKGKSAADATTMRSLGQRTGNAADDVMTAAGRLRSGNTNTSNETIRMPVNGTFVFSLLATYSPKSIRENFTLDAYLKGNLRGKGYV